MKSLKIAVSLLALTAYDLVVLLLLPRAFTGADGVLLALSNLCLVGAALLWFFTDRTRAVSAASVSLCAWVGAGLVCAVSLGLMLMQVSLRSAALSAGVALCLWGAAVLAALQTCVPRVGGEGGRRIPPSAWSTANQTGSVCADPFSDPGFVPPVPPRSPSPICTEPTPRTLKGSGRRPRMG